MEQLSRGGLVPLTHWCLALAMLPEANSVLFWLILLRFAPLYPVVLSK